MFFHDWPFHVDRALSSFLDSADRKTYCGLSFGVLIMVTCPSCGASFDPSDSVEEEWGGDEMLEFLVCPECGHRDESSEFSYEE